MYQYFLNQYVYLWKSRIFFLLCVLTEICLIRLNTNISLTQAIASFFGTLIAFGFPSLYATLVIVACSQLEKLRAALLDIKQTHVISDHYSGEDNHHHHNHHHYHSERHLDISEHVFQHMQKQLKDCLRHHQKIQL